MIKDTLASENLHNMPLTEQQKQQILASPKFKTLISGVRKPATTTSRVSLMQRAEERRMGKIKPEITPEPIEEPGILAARGEELKETFEKTRAGEITPIETGIRTVGTTIAGLGDLLFEGLKKVTPEFIKKPLRKGVEKVAETETAQKAIQELNEFEQNFPRAAENVKSLLQIGEIVPIGKGAKIAGKAVAPAARRGAEVVEKGLEKQIKQEAIDIIKPKLSKSEKIELSKQGKRTKKGLLGEITIDATDRDIEVAGVIENLVKKSNNPSKNIDIIDNEISVIGESVEQNLKGFDEFKYTRKELSPILNSAKQSGRRELLFAGDTSLEKAYDAVIKRMDRIAKQNDDTLAGLLQARKNFDKEIKELLPNAFSKEAGDNARRKAILDVRQGVNSFIESKLPVDSKFRNELKRQSLMFEAIENIAVKNVADINTNVLQRMVRRVSQSLPSSILIGSGLVVGGLTGLFNNPVALGALMTLGAAKVGKNVITSRKLKELLSKILRAGQLKPDEILEVEKVIKMLPEPKFIPGREFKGGKSGVVKPVKETLEEAAAGRKATGVELKELQAPLGSETRPIITPPPK